MTAQGIHGVIFYVRKVTYPKQPSSTYENSSQKIYKLSTYVAIMREKIQPSRKPVSGKGLTLNLNILHPEHHSKMVESRENSLHYMAEYAQY